MLKEYFAYINDNPKGYWFKARLYGWGWTPARWQGWLTLIVFIGGITWNAFRIDRASHSVSDTLFIFLPETFILLGILIAICYATGEKPRWMWGVPDKYKEKK